MPKYTRDLAELRNHAILHWPKELLERLADQSPIHKILSTQDKFLGLLKVADKTPTAWLEVLQLTELPGNVFLKHLMILADLGGEALNKLTPLEHYFPNAQMEYHWRDKDYLHSFIGAAGETSLANGTLKVDTASLISSVPLNPKMIDVAMLILFAGVSKNATSDFSEEVRGKAIIGNLLGKPDAIETFVSQNYIRVSRQMTGADANKLGQITQDYVLEKLSRYLESNWQLKRSGTIPGISQTGGLRDTSFDVVAISPRGIYFAVEVSFQVTTNSVIERKAGQAEARYTAVTKLGHYVTYVLDGAGNINIRTGATSTICRYSHCTVAFSDSELAVLADFMTSKG